MDVIQQAIDDGAVHSSNISFDRLRNLAGRARGCWSELGRGRAILTSYDQLDQYLHSYGPMTKSQWGTFLSGLSLPSDKGLHLVDYGCGQGLATALLFDNYNCVDDLRWTVSGIVLVEPSKVALERARAVVECYCPSADLSCVNKKLDEVLEMDLQLSQNCTNLHLFSNVLDIKGFDRAAIFKKIFATAGHHIVFAVSHNRDHNGGSARIRTLADAISDEKYAQWLSVEKSKINEFDCSNGMPAISWELRLKVLK